MRVLTVDIDDTTVQMMANAGLHVEACDHGGEFDIEDWADVELYSAIVLNLNTAGGIYVCRTLRKKNNSLPVIGVVSTADRNFTEQRIAFLDNGGDDLLDVPLNPRELIAVVRTILRRSDPSQVKSSIFDLYYGRHTVHLNLPEMRCRVNDLPVHLTTTEFIIFRQLATNLQRTLTKINIFEALYTNQGRDEPQLKIIDVLICKIRTKLDNAAEGLGASIATVWGRGYCFEASKQRPDSMKEVA